MRALTAAAAALLTLTACSNTSEPATEPGPRVTDPVAALEVAQQVEPGLDQCDTEQTIDLAGAGTAACIVPDEYLTVGVPSNILTVRVFADSAAQAEYAETFGDDSIPTYAGDGWTVSAPSQSLVDQVVAALDE